MKEQVVDLHSQTVAQDRTGFRLAWVRDVQWCRGCVRARYRRLNRSKGRMVWESGSICQSTKPVGCTQASQVNNGGLGTADLKYITQHTWRTLSNYIRNAIYTRIHYKCCSVH